MKHVGLNQHVGHHTGIDVKLLNTHKFIDEYIQTFERLKNKGIELY